MLQKLYTLFDDIKITIGWVCHLTFNGGFDVHGIPQFHEVDNTIVINITEQSWAPRNNTQSCLFFSNSGTIKRWDWKNTSFQKRIGGKRIYNFEYANVETSLRSNWASNINWPIFGNVFSDICFDDLASFLRYWCLGIWKRYTVHGNISCNESFYAFGLSRTVSPTWRNQRVCYWLTLSNLLYKRQLQGYPLNVIEK